MWPAVLTPKRIPHQLPAYTVFRLEQAARRHLHRAPRLVNRPTRVTAQVEPHRPR